VIFFLHLGGLREKLKGRVGDVPMVGCGGYANETGAATAAGRGESIIKIILAKKVVDNMERGTDAQVRYIFNSTLGLQWRVRKTQLVINLLTKFIITV
jgi:hypothetical protein